MKFPIHLFYTLSCPTFVEIVVWSLKQRLAVRINLGEVELKSNYGTEW